MSSQQQIREFAETACARHPYGFEVASIDDDALSRKPGSFSVTLRQPRKPPNLGDKEWWDAIVAIRNEIEQIQGVSRVYIVLADRGAAPT
jgi:hypothetical protein